MARLSTLLVTVLGLTCHTCLVYAREHQASKVFLNGRDVNNVYDYVIIGAGTAGLTVADRLTEDGKTTVLVIEYGPLSMSHLPSCVFLLTSYQAIPPPLRLWREVSREWETSNFCTT
jgi:hypothetical protein